MQDLASYSILNSTSNLTGTRRIRPDGRHFFKFRPTETLEFCAISSSFAAAAQHDLAGTNLRRQMADRLGREDQRVAREEK
jgi:hypothetical protein